MDSASNNEQQMQGTYTVRDPIRILKALLLLVLVGWFTVTLDYEIVTVHFDTIPWNALFSNENTFKSVGVIALNVLTLGVFFRLIALWSGVQIDLDARVVKFPGGNVSPNSIFDFVSPKFLLQYFLRYNVKMDDIRQLSQSTKGKYVRNWWSGGDKLKRLYAVNINGNFGAASVWFDDQGKCEEVYSAIRQMNRMGDPIFMS